MKSINTELWFITYELEQMSKYLDLVQTSLQQQFEELKASYQADMAHEMTEDEAAYLDGHYTDAFIEIGREFPQLLLLSFIITWYSLVEQKLIDLCEKLKLSISIGPKDNDYLDKGIRRARKFLLKAKNYEIDANHWQELVNIGKLRNTIVHEGNRLVYDYIKPDGKSVSYTRDDGLTVYINMEEALFCYLQKHNIIDLSIPPFVDITPSFDYCKYLIKFGRELFSKIYTDLMPNLSI